MFLSQLKQPWNQMDSTGWPSGSRVAFFLLPEAELSNFQWFLKDVFHRGKLVVYLSSWFPFGLSACLMPSDYPEILQRTCGKKRSNNEIKHGYMDPTLEEKKNTGIIQLHATHMKSYEILVDYKHVVPFPRRCQNPYHCLLLVEFHLNKRGQRPFIWFLYRKSKIYASF